MIPPDGGSQRGLGRLVRTMMKKGTVSLSDAIAGVVKAEDVEILK
jgi:hypothetical protein